VTKPSFGIIVGRFQVHELHDGHMELFRQVRSRHNRVVVFIGVSGARGTKHNPLDFETRKKMVQAKFPDFTVLPIADVMTDEAWSENLDAKIREVAAYGDVVLYGGRDSFVPHYHGNFKPVELALDPQTMKVKGEDIRSKLTNQVMESADFRAGAIYAAMNQFPRVVTTVDVVIWHRTFTPLNKPRTAATRETREFLLGRKAGEPGWRFIGGHAEPKHSTFEEDARAEAMEEAGLDLGRLKYIGSAIVPDWRYEEEDDKIKTLVFAGESMTLAARAGDDIDEIGWFDEGKLVPGLFVPTHHPLLEIVQTYFGLVQGAKNADTVTA